MGLGRVDKLTHSQELSNDMLHVACSQVNRVDSRLLVVGSHFLSNWQF
jgi:ABC-type transporter Mla MlaB component